MIKYFLAWSHDIFVIFFDTLVSDNTTVANDEYNLIKKEKLKEEYCNEDIKNSTKEHEDAEIKIAMYSCPLCNKKLNFRI